MNESDKNTALIRNLMLFMSLVISVCMFMQDFTTRSIMFREVPLIFTFAAVIAVVVSDCILFSPSEGIHRRKICRVI